MSISGVCLLPNVSLYLWLSFGVFGFSSVRLLPDVCLHACGSVSECFVFQVFVYYLMFASACVHLLLIVLFF